MVFGIERKHVIIILLIMSFVFSLCGSTLAYWNWQTSEDQHTEVVFTAEQDFTCSADGGGNITDQDAVIMPASCMSSEHAIKREVTVNVNKLGNLDVYMDLWLDINDLGIGLSETTKFRYALTTSDTSCTDGVVLSGSFNGKTIGDKVNILSKDYSSTTTEKYYLYIWLDKSETSIATMNQTFNLSIGGECIGSNKTSYAVYSNTDNSLRFYKSEVSINVGDTYEGRSVTAVYTGFESSSYDDETTVPWYNHRENITSVVFEDVISPISVANWFKNFTNCTSMELSNLDTSNVTSMYHTFDGMSSLTELDVSGFDTSNVTTMSTMFHNCSSLTSLDLSSFNTSKVTTMYSIFKGMTKLTNLNISVFDTSEVINMGEMFQQTGLTSLDISHFDTSKVTNMSKMFKEMFYITSLDLSNFNTSNVNSMYEMFANSYILANLNVDNFDTSKVTTMYNMFYNVKTTSLDLSSFDTSKVTDMSRMFWNCNKLTTIYVSNTWNTSTVTSSDSMFYNNLKLVGGLGTTFNSNYIDKTYARIDATGTPGYFTLKTS